MLVPEIEVLGERPELLADELRAAALFDRPAPLAVRSATPQPPMASSGSTPSVSLADFVASLNVVLEFLPVHVDDAGPGNMRLAADERALVLLEPVELSAVVPVARHPIAPRPDALRVWALRIHARRTVER